MSDKFEPNVDDSMHRSAKDPYKSITPAANSRKHEDFASLRQIQPHLNINSIILEQEHDYASRNSPNQEFSLNNESPPKINKQQQRNKKSKDQSKSPTIKL